MANPNISLLGATYSDVSGVTLPKQGGGTATFPWVEGSQTVTQNGTVDVTNLAEVVVNVSGGGGASNIVTGTFKGTTAGAAMDVTLNYTGSGYPIAAVIYPTGGAYDSSAASGTNAYKWYNLIQRYAIGMYAMSKNIPGTAPIYDTSQGTTYSKAAVLALYKSSTSSATSTAATRTSDATIMRDNNATANATEAVKFRSNTKMSVFIASTSYGFAANIEYTYHVIYSS